MPLWRHPWPGLALLPLLWGCALRSTQPGPPPPPCALGPESVAWGLSGGQGLLIGACLGCLPALAWLWLGGRRHRGRLARARPRRDGAALLTRLRFLRREINKLMAQGRRQALVVELGSRRRAGHQPPPGRDQGGL